MKAQILSMFRRDQEESTEARRRQRERGPDMVARASLLLFLAVGLCACVATARASVTILPGYDLLNTAGPTYVIGLPNQSGATMLDGVSFGSVDFGSGPVATGTTDTIIQRTSPITYSGAIPSGPVAFSTPISLFGLQLRTDTQVDLGAGMGYYYFTLSTSIPSTGTLTITSFDTPTSGTFATDFTVFFDVRFAGPGGPITSAPMSVMNSLTYIGVSGSEHFQSTGHWNQDPINVTSQGIPAITGVNSLLNGSSNSNDFFPIGPITEVAPTAIHTVLPEPGNVLVGMLLMGVCAVRSGWSRRRGFPVVNDFSNV